MNSASDRVSAVFGVALAALVVWGIVHVVNQPRKLKASVPALVVAACLWLPFGWLLLARGRWDAYRLSWLKMGPYLPGLLPGALLFHPRQELLEFSTMALTTLVLLLALTWLAYRGRVGLIAAAVIALLISVPSSLLAYTAYLS